MTSVLRYIRDSSIIRYSLLVVFLLEIVFLSMIPVRVSALYIRDYPTSIIHRSGPTPSPTLPTDRRKTAPEIRKHIYQISKYTDMIDMRLGMGGDTPYFIMGGYLHQEDMSQQYIQTFPSHRDKRGGIAISLPRLLSPDKPMVIA